MVIDSNEAFVQQKCVTELLSDRQTLKEERFCFLVWVTMNSLARVSQELDSRCVHWTNCFERNRLECFSSRHLDILGFSHFTSRVCRSLQAAVPGPSPIRPILELSWSWRSFWKNIVLWNCYTGYGCLVYLAKSCDCIVLDMSTNVIEIRSHFTDREQRKGTVYCDECCIRQLLTRKFTIRTAHRRYSVNRSSC